MVRRVVLYNQPTTDQTTWLTLCTSWIILLVGGDVLISIDIFLVISLRYKLHDFEHCEHVRVLDIFFKGEMRLNSFCVRYELTFGFVL
jgi:hypothetical protein